MGKLTYKQTENEIRKSRNVNNAIMLNAARGSDWKKSALTLDGYIFLRGFISARLMIETWCIRMGKVAPEHLNDHDGRNVPP